MITNDINKLVKLKEYQIKLLRELNKSVLLRSKEYYVKEYSLDRLLHVLVEVETGRVVLHDKITRINSYLNLRNLQHKVVYEDGISMNIKTLTYN